VRLTKLELHGFKSFANRQLFVFEPGITAIIALGPKVADLWADANDGVPAVD